jgi:hypothetical protein
MYFIINCSFYLILNKRFKYYSNYSGYRVISTIQLSKETKDTIASFGTKNETYEDIIKRIYNLALKQQMNDFLMDFKGYMTLDDARDWVEKKNKLDGKNNG